MLNLLFSLALVRAHATDAESFRQHVIFLEGSELGAEDRGRAFERALAGTHLDVTAAGFLGRHVRNFPSCFNRLGESRSPFTRVFRSPEIARAFFAGDPRNALALADGTEIMSTSLPGAFREALREPILTLFGRAAKRWLRGYPSATVAQARTVAFLLAAREGVAHDDLARIAFKILGDRLLERLTHPELALSPDSQKSAALEYLGVHLASAPGLKASTRTRIVNVLLRYAGTPTQFATFLSAWHAFDASPELATSVAESLRRTWIKLPADQRSRVEYYPRAAAICTAHLER